jgi:hypothetical protein
MENKTIHLVLTEIENGSGKFRVNYIGEFEISKCIMKLSFQLSQNALGIPLWFTSRELMLNYIDNTASNNERDFFLVQEFTHKCDKYQDEAKIIFSCKSDSFPVLKEGITERAPGVWANVRSFFIPDKAAAEDYVRRFNEDALAAFEYKNKN